MVRVTVLNFLEAEFLKLIKEHDIIVESDEHLSRPRKYTVSKQVYWMKQEDINYFNLIENDKSAIFDKIEDEVYQFFGAVEKDNFCFDND